MTITTINKSTILTIIDCWNIAIRKNWMITSILTILLKLSYFISNFDDVPRITSYFVFLELGIEIYKKVEEMQPVKYFLYSKINRIGEHKTGFYILTMSRLYFIYLDKEKVENKAFFEYVMYLMEKHKITKTPYVNVDLTECFLDFKLRCLTPYYCFNYDRFVAEEQTRKKIEKEKKEKDGEED